MNANDGLTMCLRCTGTGITAFRHVDGGRCFDCLGLGKVEASNRPARPREGVIYSPERIRENDRLTLRNIYRNARDGIVTYEDVTDGGNWDAARLDRVMNENPGSREAFRALGWPV